MATTDPQVNLLHELDSATASLIQVALRELGFYQGTTAGRPGPKTEAAYLAYLKARNEPRDAVLAEMVATLAEQEVGVREVPKNSNTGPRVKQYQEATWLDGTEWPWCAAFICWLVKTSIDKGIKIGFKRPETASAWGFKDWASDQGLVRFDPRGNRKRIERGDILVYTFSHIGLAVQDTTGTNIQTIEGNTDATGGREGGGVYQQNRKRDLVQMVIRLKRA